MWQPLIAHTLIPHFLDLSLCTFIAPLHLVKELNDLGVAPVILQQ